MGNGRAQYIWAMVRQGRVKFGQATPGHCIVGWYVVKAWVRQGSAKLGHSVVKYGVSNVQLD